MWEKTILVNIKLEISTEFYVRTYTHTAISLCITFVRNSTHIWTMRFHIMCGIWNQNIMTTWILKESFLCFYNDLYYAILLVSCRDKIVRDGSVLEEFYLSPLAYELYRIFKSIASGILGLLKKSSKNC